MRSRFTRAFPAAAVGVAFALLFAPGETLSAHAERSATEVAAAVLAPTFVSTQLTRPEPLAPPAAEDGSDAAPVPALLAAVAVAAALSTSRRLAALAASTPARRRGPTGHRRRAPPLPSVPAFA